MPLVALVRIQNEVELSVTADGSVFGTSVYWPTPLARRRPNEPAWAAAAETVAVPVPSVALHALVEPDSNPSPNTTSG